MICKLTGELSEAAMETGPNFFFLVSACFLVASSLTSALPTSPLLGVSPQDEKYFYSTAVIACKDGSKSFSRDRLNDGFCDCADGTSACPDGRFYCRNVGSTPCTLFSSRVNDRICDCCDGSDEYDGGINCPNTCIKNGNVVKEKNEYNLTRTDLDSINIGGKKNGSNFEELIQKLKEFKILLMLEVVLVGCLMTFGLFRRRIRSRRRRYR
ncbi:glucosidase 2 subunit beta isoform X2 [Magnolia sinica]|uniref:glucosidase 2 subunit beta isoform X2 n=1 Tax=Magnolia sinica TaxID=86752 RepID=UPI002658D74A|nr:glucosidase 2 subunit beta isoform X2 [Magnolia sinica]